MGRSVIRRPRRRDGRETRSTGNEGAAEYYRTWWNAFDTEVSPEQPHRTAEGGAVAETRRRGKHTGQFLSVPATGREIEVSVVVFVDFRGELMSGDRTYWDRARTASAASPAGARTADSKAGGADTRRTKNVIGTIRQGGRRSANRFMSSWFHHRQTTAVTAYRPRTVAARAGGDDDGNPSKWKATAGHMYRNVVRRCPDQPGRAQPPHLPAPLQRPLVVVAQPGQPQRRRRADAWLCR
ncbi:ester cyclase [Streptomyces fulvoviolaceus]|uniref:ester cyclase n=1 Tax=Streptomyces fulvoviolaceus TaxID=285535 RepID=UPI0021BEC68D|nr:ester cyclase [Streptomyces fulvoviolaceus]MCT9081325.1 ester cyclase [Streptomyces fulvoviolaceus]